MPRPRNPEARAAADAELAAACRAGQVEAYEQLYRLHGARMKSIAYHFLRDKSDAEDAIQETFIKVHRSIDRFQGNAAFSSWCYRILLNTCVDMMRRRRHRPATTAEEEPDRDPCERLPGHAEDHPLRLTLEKCLRDLPLRTRTVFLLFEVEGLRHREIAEMLEIPEGTSKTLLFDAKKRLQKALWPVAPDGRA